VLAAYPLAMAFALVYTGEHYVTDLVAGALLTAVVCLVEPPLVRATTRAARAVAAWRPAPSFAAPAVSRLDSSTRSD
jgi:membrane-associated phospholipid phosphatase